MLDAWLLAYQDRLFEIEEHARQDIEAAPEGSLAIFHGCSKERLYWKREGVRTYLPEGMRPVAARLAQKSYAKKVIHRVRREIAAIQSLIEVRSLGGKEAMRIQVEGGACPDADLGSLAGIYSSLPDSRKSLVVPYVVSNEEYARCWVQEEVDCGAGYEEGAIYATERGELVRSKSEVIIADKLYRAGVPYRYEETVCIADSIIHPDFTILKVSTREVVYWEHFGMMGDPEYCARCLMRLNAYAKEGVVLGQGLVATFESSHVPLDMQAVDAIIRALL